MNPTDFDFKRVAQGYRERPFLHRQVLERFHRDMAFRPFSNGLDVGCGAGFPGVPTAIARPGLQVTLLDSLGKRVDFLREACGKLGLENVECIHQRAEEFAGERRETFDLAVSRAVAALPVLCELCLPLVKVGGAFWAMKSVDTEEEISASKTAVKVLGGRIQAVSDYTIPTTEVVHRVVCIQKTAPTPKKYPRRFALIKKQPL